MEPDSLIIPHPQCLKVNYIVATFSEPSTHDFDKQSPNPFAKEMLSCRSSAIENCYEISESEFRLRFQMRAVVSKAAHQLGERDRFEVRLLDQPFVLYGMNFAGRLLITHKLGNIRRLIFLPGRLTYDPCGLTNHKVGHEFLTEESALFLQSLVAAQVKAAKEGVPEQFMQSLHNVHQEANDLYVSRQHLMRWMTDQVCFACYPKPQSQKFKHYGEYILNQVDRNNLDLREKGRGHTKEYLEWYLRAQNGTEPEKVRPSYQYYYALRRVLPEDELRNSAGTLYQTVIKAADQQEPGQGVFLRFLPRYIRAWNIGGTQRITFEELRQRTERALKEYQDKMREVEEEIITEVKILQESTGHNGERCSLF